MQWLILLFSHVTRTLNLCNLYLGLLTVGTHTTFKPLSFAWHIYFFDYHIFIKFIPTVFTKTISVLCLKQLVFCLIFPNAVQCFRIQNPLILSKYFSCALSFSSVSVQQYWTITSSNSTPWGSCSLCRVEARQVDTPRSEDRRWGLDLKHTTTLYTKHNILDIILTRGDSHICQLNNMGGS